MKKIGCFIIVMCVMGCIDVYPQLQNSNWCFGQHAGVNFSSNSPFWSASNATVNTPGIEGQAQASVSNTSGVLQFYTDGITVWDRNHQVLNNGTDLFGYTEFAGFQKVVIVPKPRHPNLYYIFSLGLIYTSAFIQLPSGQHGGIHYSVVDMTPGNERVVQGLKNIPLKTHYGAVIDYPLDYVLGPQSPEYITQHTRTTTSLHFDGDKIWFSVVADFDPHNAGIHSRYFYNYLITENGIIDGVTSMPVLDGISPRPVVASLLSNADYPIKVSSPGYYLGAMKIALTGNWMCDAEEQAVNLYSYNNLTGNISIPVSANHNIYLTSSFALTGMGVEFSPNGQLIYFTETTLGAVQSSLVSRIGNFQSVYQYKIQSDSLYLIFRKLIELPQSVSNIIIPISPQVVTFGLQLGVDYRIYACEYSPLVAEQNKLAVITSPNQVGTACGYVSNGFMLLSNTFHNQQLPQWVFMIGCINLPLIE